MELYSNGLAEIHLSWLGKIYSPADAFSNTIGLLGGTVSADAIYQLA